MARVKTVGNNSFVAHKWTVAEEARSGSMSTDDGILYSYRTPIAVAIQPESGCGNKERVYFITSESFSQTTAKHKNEAHRATRYQNVIQCPIVRHPDNCSQVAFAIQYFSAKADEAWKAIQGAAKPYKIDKLNAWQANRDKIDEIIRLFNLPKSTKPPMPEKQADIEDRFRVYQSYKDESEAKKAAKHAAKHAAILAEQERKKAEREQKRLAWLEQIKPILAAKLEPAKQAWRNTGSATLLQDLHKEVRHSEIQISQCGSYAYYDWTEILDTDMLRISGDKVITNRSAEVPLNEAVNLLNVVLKMWKCGKTYKFNGHQSSDISIGEMRVGSFILNEISDSFVIVGCHKFSRAEIEIFADSIPSA